MKLYGKWQTLVAGIGSDCVFKLFMLPSVVL